MKHRHPILIVEDDHDDCELVQSALASIGVKNETKCFYNGEDALRYLASTDAQTFLILSDINMPKLTGIDLKKAINKDDTLRKQSIPFILLSTSASPKEVDQAYDVMVQGFFQKPATHEELKLILQKIVGYWSDCKHPSSN